MNSFIQLYELKHLGVPRFIACGIFEHEKREYRFIVMDRFSNDIQTLFKERNNQFNEEFVLNLTRQILYSLEYIHSKGYANADIKGTNLMLNDEEKLYLIDYGLAHRYSRDGKHQIYVQNADAKHNGTIEYTSRDAHYGVRKCILSITVIV